MVEDVLRYGGAPIQAGCRSARQPLEPDAESDDICPIIFRQKSVSVTSALAAKAH